MSILITGGAGFIGSACASALVRSNQSVVVVDTLDERLYPRAAKEANLSWARGYGELTFHHADVRDASALERILARHGVTDIVHLAAAPGVRASVADPTHAFDVNVAGTAAMFQAGRRTGVRRYVLASSSSVYGAREEVPFPEDDPADRPLSPYAASKRSLELLAHAHHAAYDLDVTCLRFFTVYGPRQRPDMAIHHFLRCVLERRPLPVFGDGTSARDYTFVDDTVAAILSALEKVSGFRIYNVGTGRTVSLSDLVALVAEVTGTTAAVERHGKQPGDVPITCADPRRIEADLGWQASVELRDGLARTWAWLARMTG